MIIILACSIEINYAAVHKIVHSRTHIRHFNELAQSFWSHNTRDYLFQICEDVCLGD